MQMRPSKEAISRHGGACTHSRGYFYLEIDVRHIQKKSMSKNVKLTNRLRETLADDFTRRLIHAVPAISEALYDAGNRCDDPDQKRVIQIARDIWDGRSTQWEPATRDEFVKLFDGKIAHDDTASNRAMAFDAGSMKLVDDEEMREDILLINVGKRLRDWVNSEFSALTKRLEGLQDVAHIPERVNPFVPRLFVRALMTGLAAADANRSQRCEIIAAAEFSLRDILEGTLREGNEMLVGDGFMIELPVKFAKPIIARSAGARTNNANSTNGTDASNAGDDAASGGGNGGGNGGGAGWSTEDADAGGIAALLSRLLTHTAHLTPMQQMPQQNLGMPAGVPMGMPTGATVPPEVLLAQLLMGQPMMPAGAQQAMPQGIPAGGAIPMTPLSAAAAAPSQAMPSFAMDANLVAALDRFAAGVAANPLPTFQAVPTGAPMPPAGYVFAPRMSPAANGIADGSSLPTIAIDEAAAPDQVLTAEQIALAQASAQRAVQHTNLVRQAQPELSPQMQPVQAVITDVVAGFFDSIFEADDIPDSIKALVGKLQIQMLKASMADPQIFTNAQHPFRRFVDKLVDIGVKRQQSLVAGNPAFEKISAIVDIMHEKFDGDTKVVEAAEEMLSEFLEVEEASTQEVLDDSVEEVQREEKHEMARSMARFEVEKRLRGKSFPNSIRVFAVDYWQQLLAADYIIDAEDGEQWKADLQTLDDLLWSLLPLAEQADRTKLLKILPTLLSRLNDGLDRIGISKDERAPYFQVMVEVHTTALRSMKPVVPPVPVEDKDAPSTPPPADPRKSLRKRSSGIERGQWVELTDTRGYVARCKLSWVSPLKETFVLKNYDTKEAITLKADEWKELKAAGRLRLIEETSVSERSLIGALRGVLERPRANVAAASATPAAA